MKYTKKWTPGRSRILFIIKVIIRWFNGSPGILYTPGIHLIDGPAGSGKTLLGSIIIHNITDHSNRFVWTNMDEFKTPKAKTFDIDKLFSDGHQNFRLNKWMEIDEKKCRVWGLFIDEINAKFNRRMNRQKDYNDVFVPLVAMMVTHRHQLCDHVYLMGQSLLLQDSQLQAIVKVRHTVSCSKRWRYWWFREKSIMLYLPKWLKIYHFLNIGVDNQGNVIWEPVKKVTKIKVTPADIEGFDTHAFEKLTDGLPQYLG